MSVENNNHIDGDQPHVMTINVDNPDGYKRAAIPIFAGLGVIAAIGLSCWIFPPNIASILVGIIVSATCCYIIQIAMPRAIQLSLMGAAIGVSTDAGYAKLNGETPVTIANALVKLADSMATGAGIVAADAHVNTIGFMTHFVWALILSAVVFMAFSFIIKQDG